MKLDKDTVIKQRFWFLLPLVFVLIFLAMGSVWSISSQAEQMVGEVQNKYNQVKSLGVQVTDKLLAQLREERERAIQLRWELWTRMFDLQNDVVIEEGQPVIHRPMIRWPEHAELQKFATRDFGQPFRRDEFPHDLFRTHFLKLYEPLLDILPLYDEKTGRGAVRVAPIAGRAMAGGGDVGGFGPRFGAGPGAAGKTTREMMLDLLEPPHFGEGNLTIDEIWLALEDVAVRRMILEAIREVLDQFADLKPEFVPVGGSEHEKPNKPESKTPATLGKPDFGKAGFSKPTADKAPGDATVPNKPSPQPEPTPPSEGKTPEKSASAQDKPTASAPEKGTEKATTPDGKAATDKAVVERKLVVRQRFYNMVWYYEQLGELTEAEANKPLPILGRDEGWLLDVRVTAEFDAPGKLKQYYLELVSQNYSPRFDIPEMPVRVWLQTTSGQRVAIDVPDAGSVPKAVPEGPKPGQKPVRRANEVPLVSKPSERVVPALPIRLPPPQPSDNKDASLPEVEGILAVQRIPPKNALDYQRLANPHWIMDIQIQRARNGVGFEAIGQVYNRSGRRQIPPAFELLLTDGTNETRKEIRPVKKPVDAYTIGKFEESLGILASVPRQLVGVRQVLDWQTTPIKRIDLIRIGEGALVQADRLWHSRLYVYPFHLKAQNRQDILDFSDAFESVRGGARGAAPGVPGKPSGLPGAGQGSGPAGPTDFGPQDAQQRGGALVTRNGIPLARYYPANPSDTTLLPNAVPEVRRLPIALVLIADYSALSDIQVALANSPLRIQITQSVLTRHPPLGPPPPPASQAPKPGATGIGDQESTPITTGDVVGSEAAEMNLIELQLFGLAYIYENPYMSQEWLAPQGGGPGPRFGPPPGGGKPPTFGSPGGGDRRTPFGPGRRGGPRGRR